MIVSEWPHLYSHFPLEYLLLCDNKAVMLVMGVIREWETKKGIFAVFK